MAKSSSEKVISETTASTAGANVAAFDASKKPDMVWILSCTAITAAAILMRFVSLGLKPFHHDEGVNGYFLNTLFRDGVYKYDASNYHGPTLYYISLAFAKVFGLETIPVRASMAIFGVLTVVLIFFLRRYIGTCGSLSAAAFVALSPGMVFISRYFIHEILFVFLALAMFLSILLFIDNKKAGIFSVVWMVVLLFSCFLPSALTFVSYMSEGSPGWLWPLRIGAVLIEAVLIFFVIRMLMTWDNGRPIYLLLASASVSLMFATKETAFITLGTMMIAIFCIMIWQKIYRPDGGPEDARISWQNFSAAMGTGKHRIILITAAALVFAYIWALFFSSFFTFAEGISRSFEAYSIWTKTGTKDHKNVFLAYLNWGMAVEAPIYILSVLGIILSFFKSRFRVALFVGLWALGLFLAYSIIPYKTPWLALSFLLPMAIIAGYGLNELFTASGAAAKASAAILGSVAVLILGYQSYDLNFVAYDDNSRTYIYAHTRREFLTMMDKIYYYADKSGKGKQAAVDVVSPDYWPMVWYAKDHPKIIFHGKMLKTSGAEMIVTKKTDQDRDAKANFASGYKLEGIYPLRPGVDLVLLVRNDIADSNVRDLDQLR